MQSIIINKFNPKTFLISQNFSLTQIFTAILLDFWVLNLFKGELELFTLADEFELWLLTWQKASLIYHEENISKTYSNYFTCDSGLHQRPTPPSFSLVHFFHQKMETKKTTNLIRKSFSVAKHKKTLVWVRRNRRNIFFWGSLTWSATVSTHPRVT